MRGVKMKCVTFTIARNGAILREYDKEAFEAAISAGEILPSDDYWTEGMADWEFVRNYGAHPAASRMAQTVKISPERMAQTVKIEMSPRASLTVPNTPAVVLNQKPASNGSVGALLGAFFRSFRGR
jgi:hypothetical protein